MHAVECSDRTRSILRLLMPWLLVCFLELSYYHASNRKYNIIQFHKFSLCNITRVASKNGIICIAACCTVRADLQYTRFLLYPSLEIKNVLYPCLYYYGEEMSEWSPPYDTVQYIFNKFTCWIHYNDVTMGSMASQITSLTIVYSTIYSGADHRKHQSSVSLGFVREFTGDR